MQITSSTDTILVSFPLDDGSFENLHSRRINADDYIIDNSPFYVYDISHGDTVTVEHRSGRVLFVSVKERGGHSTYRLRLASGQTHNQFLISSEQIRAHGCTFEGSGAGDQRLYAIDVPPAADIRKIYSLLEEGEERGEWEFEEAHFFKGYES